MLRKGPQWGTQAFGASLQDLARAGQPPHVLLDSLRFLAARGLTTPGLFSCAVNKRQLLALKEAYDGGRRALRSARVAANLDPPAAANLLLLWLGALPEPLFPAEHVPAVLEIHGRAGATRADRVASMRCLLKRTEPFIVEALYPLFELLHHYWINQPAREETLSDLAAIFSGPVFGTPAEHGAPPEAAGALADAAALLISEYRPLFTQPYNLQRYAADLQRQATAAEAKATAARASAAEAAAGLSAPGLAPLRLTPVQQHSTESQPMLSSSPSEWSLEMDSPLLTPRRVGALSVMEPAEPLLGCSPDASSPLWGLLQLREVAPTPNVSANADDIDALLEGMVASTVTAAFSAAAFKPVVHPAECLGHSDRRYSPVSIVEAEEGTGASTSPCDVSRDASDSDGEMPPAEDVVMAAAAALGVAC